MAAKADLQTGASGAGKGVGGRIPARQIEFDPEGLVQGDIRLCGHGLRALRGEMEGVLKPRLFDGERVRSMRRFAAGVRRKREG